MNREEVSRREKKKEEYKTLIKMKEREIEDQKEAEINED